jgi:hypothetical protein
MPWLCDSLLRNFPRKDSLTRRERRNGGSSAHGRLAATLKKADKHDALHRELRTETMLTLAHNQISVGAWRRRERLQVNSHEERSKSVDMSHGRFQVHPGFVLRPVHVPLTPACLHLLRLGVNAVLLCQHPGMAEWVLQRSHLHPTT